MIKAAVVGGSGYIGGELARLLSRHPKISLEAITSRQLAGLQVADTHPFLREYIDLKFTEAITGEGLDVIFLATPHGASMKLAPDLVRSGAKVIDLSGDYRLKDPETYREWYGHEHTDPENLSKAVYGLSELNWDEISEASFVANPGCYPTCSTLGLAPLFANRLVEGTVMIDAKSGTSGAGAELSKATHHSNCGASVNPYKVGRHRHTPEIAQTLSIMQGSRAEVVFTPHLIPVVRGMLCTMYLKLNQDLTKQELLGMYNEFFRRKRFVRITEVPWMQAVVGSNHCEVGLEVVGNMNVVVMSVIDNLVKGGAGQAIQNCNAMFGWSEETGLDFPGLGV
ncbi:MAG: N-acetyl-gamma-glutamyl-phosphate reductase [Methanomassiliicoccales archaeon]|nr:N-acetyl-gamma-glutamyl-phosphate reductase [Methanomassiliicoccales archaeon]